MRPAGLVVMWALLIAPALRAELCPENPFVRWLRSEDAKCAPSGELTSPTATLRAQLPAGTTGVVYAPRRAIAYPLMDRTTVPAGEELWLIAVSKSSPVAVVQIPAIPDGNERSVDARDAAAEGTVLGWLHVSDEDRAALKAARGVRAPQIVVISGSKRIEAQPLSDIDMLGGAFVLFRDVPAGPAELLLSGRGWLTRRQQIRVESRRITTLTDPITAAASSTLIVNWSVPGNVAALDRSLGSCEPAKETPRFELTISACAPPKKGETTPPPCQPVKSEALRLDQTFGTTMIEETPPGAYRAEIRYGKLPPVAVTTTIAPLTQRPVFLTAQYFEGYGSFTRGDKPVADDATIAFPGGGVGFSARGSGEYHAVLTQPFDTDAKIDISTCSGEKAFVLADRPSRRNTRFDIDIPDNSLAITIIDTFTRMSVTKANVRVQIMSKTSRVPVVTTNFTDPKFLMRGIPERQLRIEVTASGYKKKDIEPFTMGRSENKELEIQLEPVSGRQGMLISSHPFQNATIFWFSGVSEIERADVASDGTFTFDADHYRDETMTVVSASHPLWITRPPQAERSRTMEVRFPDSAPVRQADISLPGVLPRFTTVVGVAIGGLRVPQPALARHQALRDKTTVTTGEGPLSIVALAETGPIDILRGPSAFVPAPTIEFFAVRDFPQSESKRLQPGSASVVFSAR